MFDDMDSVMFAMMKMAFDADVEQMNGILVLVNEPAGPVEEFD